MKATDGRKYDRRSLQDKFQMPTQAYRSTRPGGERWSASSRKVISRREQFVTIAHLAVAGELAFQPRRCAAIGAIRALRPLRHDAFEIAFARDPEQIVPALLEVIEV